MRFTKMFHLYTQNEYKTTENKDFRPVQLQCVWGNRFSKE